MNMHFAAHGAQTKTLARGAKAARRARASQFISERFELEGPLAMLELRWALLQPAIEDALGCANGSGDAVVEGRTDARDFHVLYKMEADVLHFHLTELGEIIDKISDINRGRV